MAISQALVGKVSELPALQEPGYEQVFSSPSQALRALYQFSVVTGADRMKKCRGNPALLWTKAGSSLMLSGAGLQVQACSFRPTLTQRQGQKNIFWELLWWFLICCYFLLPGFFCINSKQVWQGRAVSKLNPQRGDNNKALLSWYHLSSQVSFLFREIAGIFLTDESCAVRDIMALPHIPLMQALI